MSTISADKHPPTGGGPAPEHKWWVEHVKNIIGEDNPIITGINTLGEINNNSH
jgi:hypothetical protein